MSHAQFRCRNVPRVSVGSQMVDIGSTHTHTHMHEKYLFGEQDVNRGKDSILQVNPMKEIVVRTGNNQ